MTPRDQDPPSGPLQLELFSLDAKTEPLSVPSAAEPLADTTTPSIDHEPAVADIVAEPAEKISDSPDREPIVIRLADEYHTPGTILSQARSNKGQTIAEIAKRTGISEEMIGYLETDDYGKLPAATIYAKTHIKKLCQHYGLDPDSLVARFDQAVFQFHQKTSQESTLASGSAAASSTVDVSTVRPKGWDGKLAWTMTILVMIVAVLTVAYVIRQRLLIPAPPAAAPSSIVTDADLEQLLGPEQLPLEPMPPPGR